MRTIQVKTIENPQSFKKQLLEWSQQFRELQYLDSNEHQMPYSSFDMLLGVDAFLSLKTDFSGSFDELKQWQNQNQDWLLGYLSYDLKNDIEALQSRNSDCLEFADMYFFQPKKLFILKGNQLEMSYLPMCDDEMDDDFSQILSQQTDWNFANNEVQIQPKISESDYLEKVKRMQEHILRGDIYEANLCMEFFSESATINPLATFERLNQISQAPFSAYFKHDQQYLLCASPERYLKKSGNRLISQPIKGTAARSSDPETDKKLARDLSENSKERAENIMIVDLVRNDLSRTAKPNTVKVEELCRVHSFKQVHQLISTVVSELEDNTDGIEALKTTFPMGSMTGAPKISAMKIIENLEETQRGLYSGALGYFTPNGDFDFNVVIRSILYNAKKKYVSYSVGSAITAAAIPEQEYAECLLKAKAMLEVLTDKMKTNA